MMMLHKLIAFLSIMLHIILSFEIPTYLSIYVLLPFVNQIIKKNNVILNLELASYIVLVLSHLFVGLFAQ